MSTFSISVTERDHMTALMRELRPRRPFSRPDNLMGEKRNKCYGKCIIKWRTPCAFLPFCFGLNYATYSMATLPYIDGQHVETSAAKCLLLWIYVRARGSRYHLPSLSSLAMCLNDKERMSDLIWQYYDTLHNTALYIADWLGLLVRGSCRHFLVFIRPNVAD